MSLFVLREGYRVNATSAGARVVHESTGKIVDLAPEELQVFARATAGGIDARDPQVRAVIRKFVELGVLVSARQSEQEARRLRSAAQPDPRPAVGSTSGIRYRLRVRPTSSEGQVSAGPPEPPPASKATPDETVRLFRRDLKVSRHLPSSLFEVTDPVSGKAFQLYDFEVSIARMLDGRRRYSEIVEAGQRLGIPLNFQSLIQFVRQLEVYGFLAPKGAKAAESREASEWAPSRQWDEALRALFQSGLRMHRHGRYPEAANYFEAMLEQDPQNPEALEMLEQTRQRMAGTTSPEAPKVIQESDPSQVGLEELLQEETSEPLEFTEEEPRLSNNSQTPDDLDSWPSEEEDEFQPPKSKKKIFIVGGAVVAVAVVVGLAINLHSAKPKTSARVSEGPKKNAAPTAPDAGVALAQAADPSPAPAATNQPESKAAAVPDSEPQWIEVKVERHKRPKIADVRAPASGQLRWKAASRHVVRSGEVLGNVREKRGRKERAVVSPKDGVFVPKALQGAKTRKMKKLASLLSTLVELEGYVAEKRPEKTWDCEVLSEASRLKAPCRVETVASRGSGYWVMVKAQSLDDFDEVSNPVLRLTPERPRSVSKANPAPTQGR